MTQLDHIAVVAPDLATGTAWLRDVLGVDAPRGGAHPEMGTHNHLLRLGSDVFLEVIAADPEAKDPQHRRWFCLDDSAEIDRAWHSGRHLRAYVARCSNLAEAIGEHSETFGTPMQISRGDRSWMFGVRADGKLPLDGALPCLMDWGPRGTPVPDMPDYGLQLRELLVETPVPNEVHAGLDAIGIARKPRIGRAETVRLVATIDTPRGVRTLS